MIIYIIYIIYMHMYELVSYDYTLYCADSVLPTRGTNYAPCLYAHFVLAGRSASIVGQVGIQVHVAFECCAGDRSTSYLDISNDGTTSIFFYWEVLP